MKTKTKKKLKWEQK